ncbi:hypothetical protein RF11_15080 [Thelohanellus kitauei]|uniref:Uncharacterized protein n=1 Tax=Thelohanellus kitauei TaxID=669202 RepID=A0A0C2M7A2_THEKT|nr:hypothetical protein RF11_15080 [Thelohanellus kitauei]
MEKINKNKERVTSLLLMVLRMVHHLRLLDQIYFNINQFYDVTEPIIIHNFKEGQHSFIMTYLSKIWSGIFEISGNTFQIDTIDKLKYFATIFANDLSHKLRKVINGVGKFELNKFKKQRIYILYFTLVAFGMIDETGVFWLRKVFKRLHSSFQEYLKKYSIEDITMEDQIIIIQYYIKSLETLHFHISNHDEEVFQGIFTRLMTFPSLSNIF